MTFEGTGGTQPSVSRFVQGLLPNFISVVLDVSQIRTQGRYNSFTGDQHTRGHEILLEHHPSFSTSSKHQKPHTLHNEVVCNFNSYVRGFWAQKSEAYRFLIFIPASKSTQPQKKETHKHRHWGVGKWSRDIWKKSFPLGEEALVRNQYKEEIKFNPSHMRRPEEKDQSFSS